jgi:glucan phosphorylase
VLGIGGYRALGALGIHPTTFHMNEGHSAFLGLERVRKLMEEQKLSFRQGVERSLGQPDLHQPHASRGLVTTTSPRS